MLRVLSGVGKRLSLRAIVPFILVGTGSFMIFAWKLSTLTPGLSKDEVSQRSASSSIKAIFSNPVNAPHKLLQHFFMKLEPGHIGYLRLPSVICALIICFCFFKLASGWFGRIIGLFASLIFATLPLLVILARQATPEILFFSPVIFIWLTMWLTKPDSRKSVAWIILLLSFSLLVYTPGVLLWGLAGLAIARKRIIQAVSLVPRWISALGLLLVLSNIAALIYSGLKHHGVLKSIVLIPSNTGALSLFKNIGWMILSLFIRTGTNSPFVLARIPILNILLLGLLVFGVYAMQGVAKLKAFSLAGSIIFGVIFAGLNNNIAILAFGLPAAGMFIAAGLRYLYIEWRSIFPRNPVPKTFALAFIAAVTLSQLYFGLRYSLIAWPHSQQTRSVYMLK